MTEAVIQRHADTNATQSCQSFEDTAFLEQCNAHAVSCSGNLSSNTGNTAAHNENICLAGYGDFASFFINEFFRSLRSFRAQMFVCSTSVTPSGWTQWHATK